MSKITDYAALSAAAAADLLVIVDVDDPSMAATGTTKKIQVGNLGLLQAASNLSDVASAGTARSNLAAAAINDPMQLGVTGTFVPWAQGNGAASVVTANNAWYARCVSGGYAMSNITVQVGVSSGNCCVAAYQATGTGASAVPGSRYQTSGSVATPAAGAATIALGGSCTPVLADWLALAADNLVTTFDVYNPAIGNSSLAGGFGYSQGTAFPLPSTPSSLTASLSRQQMLRGS